VSTRTAITVLTVSTAWVLTCFSGLATVPYRATAPMRESRLRSSLRGLDHVERKLST